MPVARPRSRPTLRALFAAMLATTLAACGGGGGAGDGSTPAPGPSPETEVLRTGQLWHTGTMVHKDSGTKLITLADGRSRWLTPDREPEPWPDGSRYAMLDYDVDSASTTLVIADAATGQALHTVTVGGYFRALRPSPNSGTVLLGAWSAALNATPVHEVVYDVATDQVLWASRPEDEGHRLAWHPDGRLVRLTPTGAISTLTPGGTEAAIGQAVWPAPYVPTEVRVSPAGDWLLVRGQARVGGDALSDYWLIPLTGGDAERFTDTGMVGLALWSPDGRHIAFERDPDSGCVMGGCFVNCRLGVSPASARRVTGLDAAGDARRFSAIDSFGTEQTLGCGLLAWTR